MKVRCLTCFLWLKQKNDSIKYVMFHTIQGKGKMETYWLHGEYGDIVYPPAPGAAIVDNDPVLVNEAPPPSNPPQLPPISCYGGNSSCGNPTHTAAAGAAGVTNGVDESDQHLISVATDTSLSLPPMTAATKNPPPPQTTPTGSSLIRAT